jgi:hypothetical protein
MALRCIRGRSFVLVGESGWDWRHVKCVTRGRWTTGGPYQESGLHLTLTNGSFISAASECRRANSFMSHRRWL